MILEIWKRKIQGYRVSKKKLSILMKLKAAKLQVRKVIGGIPMLF